MSTEYSKSEVIAKVQKLLRLSKSSNQHEAELAMSKASALMEMYQIEHAEVEKQAMERGTEKVVSVEYIIPGVKLKVLWLNTLAHAAAKLYDGEILINNQLHGQTVWFVGFQSEVELMKDTFHHLYISWQSFVERDLDKVKLMMEETRAYRYTPRDTMKFKHGHGQGYAAALYNRCAQIARERKAKVQAQSNTCMALVLVRDGAITKWLDEKFKGKKAAGYGRKATSGSTIGQRFGAEAGRNVAIGGSLSGGSQPQLN